MIRLCFLLGLWLSIVSTITMAQDSDATASEAPALHISGFGSLGASYHNADGLQYRRSMDQGDGIKSGKIGTGIDSLLGLQLNGELNAEWSVMAQTVVRQRASGDWDPTLAWGFVKYAPSDAVEMRVGRLGVDIYMDGDSRHVGYAYTTVRPAPDIYGMLTFDKFDGADISFHQPVGTGVGKLKLYGGRARGEANIVTSYTLPKAWTLGAKAEWSDPELTIGLAWGEINIPHDSALQTLKSNLTLAGTSLGPYGIQSLQRASEIKESARLTYLGLGVGWEHGPLSLQGIAAKYNYRSFPDYKGWMTAYTAGYRIGNWKPFATYSRSIVKATDHPLSLPPVPALQPLQNYYQTVVDRLKQDQYSWGIGVRYDFVQNAALKFQIDQVKAKRSFMLMNDAGQAVRDRKLTLFTVALDFVF